MPDKIYRWSLAKSIFTINNSKISWLFNILLKKFWFYRLPSHYSSFFKQTLTYIAFMVETCSLIADVDGSDEDLQKMPNK